jgi:hypothetical protein
LIQIACLLHTKKEFLNQFRKIQWQDGLDCSIYLEAFEENCFEDFELPIFSILPDLDFLDLDVMTDLCSETTGRIILVVLEEHPLLTPEVEETKTDVEQRHY